MRRTHKTTAKWAVIFLLLLQCLLVVECTKTRSEVATPEETFEVEADFVELFGMEFEKKKFYITVSVAVLFSLGALSQMLGCSAVKRKRRGNRPGVDGTVDVVLVGSGLPKKGMGWYHLTQLLEMPEVNVRAVVEPFYMNEDLCKGIPSSFLSFKSSTEDQGVEFATTVDDLEKFERPTLCLLAGRTNDNPKFFQQCILKGAKCIYLEKPGAPTVQELEDMKKLADSKGVKVYMGYNKNVTPYVQKAIDLSRTIDNSHVFFCHNNAYSQKDLPEVFSRNSEGMLKNMAVHELALLVTFFDVTVESINTFKVNTNKLFSEKLTIWKPGTAMPNPEYITDFSRVAFKITTKKGRHVSLMADRCGGNFSFAVVKDENGHEVQKFEYPDSVTAAKIQRQCKEDPEMMPYFFLQSDDYLELKKRVVRSMLSKVEPDGVATIKVAIEALKLAEYATEQLNKALKAA